MTIYGLATSDRLRYLGDRIGAWRWTIDEIDEALGPHDRRLPISVTFEENRCRSPSLHP